jgi:hypothetical protein
MADGEAEHVAQDSGHPVPGAFGLVAGQRVVDGFHAGELIGEVPRRVELGGVDAAAQQVVVRRIRLDLPDQIVVADVVQVNVGVDQVNESTGPTSRSTRRILSRMAAPPPLSTMYSLCPVR